eukprot:5348559-Pyramimonas_sp.AAC.1
MKLIRRLANKPVRDSRVIRVKWRIHAGSRWPLALGHARVSIEGWDEGSSPSRIPWIGTFWLPGPGRPPPLTTREGQ